jgi:hypothetical protein
VTERPHELAVSSGATASAAASCRGVPDVAPRSQLHRRAGAGGRNQESVKLQATLNWSLRSRRDPLHPAPLRAGPHPQPFSPRSGEKGVLTSG